MSFLERLAAIFDLDAWAQWLAELDRGFVFLLLLPFVIAVIGLWAYFTENERDEK